MYLSPAVEDLQTPEMHSCRVSGGLYYINLFVHDFVNIIVSGFFLRTSLQRCSVSPSVSIEQADNLKCGRLEGLFQVFEGGWWRVKVH